MVVFLYVLAFGNFFLGLTGTADKFPCGPLILRSVFKELYKLFFWVCPTGNSQMLTAFQMLKSK